MSILDSITNCISLKPVNTQDIDFLFKLRKEWNDYPVEYRISKENTPTYEQHRKFCMDFIFGHNHPYETWYIIELDKKPIGAMPLKKTGEFGYQIIEAEQGKGLIHKAFKLFFNLHPKKTVWARTIATNKRSQGLLEKYGFKLTDYEYH